MATFEACASGCEIQGWRDRDEAIGRGHRNRHPRVRRDRRGLGELGRSTLDVEGDDVLFASGFGRLDDRAQCFEQLERAREAVLRIG